MLQNQGTWVVPFVGETSPATDASTDRTPADARRWAPGTATTLTAQGCDLPAGRYDAYLDLPSGRPPAAGQPGLRVRTANEGTWVAETGWNDLHQQAS